MKNFVVFSILIISFNLLVTSAVSQNLILGTEIILDGQFYVVHSGADENSQAFNTSNIYVFQGIADTVWIFGTGYGDKSSSQHGVSDFSFYRGTEFDATRNGINDAFEIDRIIRERFGIDKNSAKLMFIVPHFHLDHINQEFLAAFFESLSYNIGKSAVFVHILDFKGATCNEPCCGDPNCTEQSEFVASPFHPSWQQAYLDLFRVIGDSNDTCNDAIMSFTSTTGTWVVKKARFRNSGGHTNGTVNLDNETLEYRVLGAFEQNPCPAPNSWHIFKIHGNVDIPTTIADDTERLPKSFELYQNYPNPFNPVTTIRFAVKRKSLITLTLYDLSGRVIKRLIDGERPAGEYAIEFDGAELASGTYFYRMQADGFSQTRSLSLIK